MTCITHLSNFSLEAMPDLLQPRQEFQLVWMPMQGGGGHLYALGGRDKGTAHASAECLAFTPPDSSGNITFKKKWRLIESMSCPRYHFGATVLCGRVIVVGGMGNFLTELHSAEIFTRSRFNGAGQWSEVKDGSPCICGKIETLLPTRFGLTFFCKFFFIIHLYGMGKA